MTVSHARIIMTVTWQILLTERSTKWSRIWCWVLKNILYPSPGNFCKPTEPHRGRHCYVRLRASVPSSYLLSSPVNPHTWPEVVHVFYMINAWLRTFTSSQKRTAGMRNFFDNCLYASNSNQQWQGPHILWRREILARSLSWPVLAGRWKRVQRNMPCNWSVRW